MILHLIKMKNLRSRIEDYNPFDQFESMIKSQDMIVQPVTSLIHYEKGILHKTIFGGVVSIIGKFIIGYFALDKALTMFAGSEPSMNSVLY